MKNKKTMYFLIPAVILVWGMIIYKIYQASDTGPRINKPIAEKIIEENEGIEEVYMLALNYRDPFFGKAPSMPTVKERIKAENNVATDAITRDIITELSSRLQFHGIIDNPRQSSRIGLITYQGRRTIVRQNEYIDDIKIVDISSGFIQVVYENNKYNINKGIEPGATVEQFGNFSQIDN
jgi:hypothetical protein